MVDTGAVESDEEEEEEELELAERRNVDDRSRTRETSIVFFSQF